nr:immunoglobulin heavy chain junction region [Macaca mulatta]MOY21745.1 immunoglobulin heavy chain junction region [Macaca mulatta]MOY22762.1 immunoglobulin heavy chain junction region [Macaca mulatta]MOY24762.1 immunoglobulin heavy chain junction region [Macaca mulatta]MOY24817.1 immunoglobulin heavy chain junction region [Macaca mulatta]
CASLLNVVHDYNSLDVW